MNKLFSLIIIAFIFSCKGSVKRTDFNDDMEDAQEYTLQFYRALGQFGIDSAKHFFYEYEDFVSGKELLLSVKNTYGDIENVEVFGIRTSVLIKDTIKEKNYYVKVKGNYSNWNTEETLNIRTIKGKLLIYEYQINGL